MKKKILYGTTRTVLLTEKYALKFPTLKSWKLFLHGLLGNMQEKQFSSLSDLLCPVVFYVPGGFLLVMPRAKPLSYQEFFHLDYDKFVNQDDFVLPIENKQDSFGILNGKIVGIDYGS